MPGLLGDVGDRHHRRPSVDLKCTGHCHTRSICAIARKVQGLTQPPAGTFALRSSPSDVAVHGPALGPPVARRDPGRCCRRGHRMAVPACGRCLCGGRPAGGVSAPRLPVVPGADGVPVWVPAACPGGRRLPEDLHSAAALPLARGDACAAAGVRAGLAAGRSGDDRDGDRCGGRRAGRGAAVRPRVELYLHLGCHSLVACSDRRRRSSVPSCQVHRREDARRPHGVN